MKYTIVTTRPKSLRDEVLDFVKKGKDKNDSSIDTWVVKVATFKGKDGKSFDEEVLVHCTQAWENVGGIRLIVDKDGNNQLHAIFFYWSDFSKDERDNTQELYLYGRLTELLLVHFNDSIKSIMMTEVNQ